jgi:hypothetical protein
VGRVMAIEIVNAEGTPAPKDGTVFNAQYSDGVVKVRWSEARGDWETALSDGRWRSLAYQRGTRPQTWWPFAASFDVDEQTAELMARLQKTFGGSGLPTNGQGGNCRGAGPPADSAILCRER